MSTHKICFHREIRKLFTGHPLLSRLCRLLSAPQTFEKYVLLSTGAGYHVESGMLLLQNIPEV